MEELGAGPMHRCLGHSQGLYIWCTTVHDKTGSDMGALIAMIGQRPQLDLKIDHRWVFDGYPNSTLLDRRAGRELCFGLSSSRVSSRRRTAPSADLHSSLVPPLCSWRRVTAAARRPTHRIEQGKAPPFAPGNRPTGTRTPTVPFPLHELVRAILHHPPSSFHPQPL